VYTYELVLSAAEALMREVIHELHSWVSLGRCEQCARRACFALKLLGPCLTLHLHLYAYSPEASSTRLQ
jgi:hypothetical protein